VGGGSGRLPVDSVALEKHTCQADFSAGGGIGMNIMAIVESVRRSLLASLTVLFLVTHLGFAEQIRVKHVEGAIHGFMILKSEAGETIAAGDLDQTTQGSRITTNIKFRFEDGSIYDQTTVFSQHGVFRVLSDHMIEKGPVYKKDMEVWIDCPSGRVKVRETKDGKDNITKYHLNIPADLANGITAILVKNLPDDSQRTFTWLAAAPKPRIVKLVVNSAGEDTFTVAGTKYKAKEYVVKIDIGGVAGVIAPVVGKQPPDIHIWIFRGETPVILKTFGQLSADSPVWQIEMSSPAWPRK
jgi:hypothetical protein